MALAALLATYLGLPLPVPRTPALLLRLLLVPSWRPSVECSVDLLGTQTSMSAGARVAHLRHPTLFWSLPPHLTRVKPVLQFVASADTWQNQAVEDVLTQRAEECAAQPETQQHKQPREVVDTHLQRLHDSHVPRGSGPIGGEILGMKGCWDCVG